MGFCASFPLGNSGKKTVTIGHHVPMSINTNLGGISQITVYLNYASEVVHCSAVILNMVSLTTCSSQNRNGCIVYLGKVGPKITFSSLLLSHVMERIWKIPHRVPKVDIIMKNGVFWCSLLTFWGKVGFWGKSISEVLGRI